jgi:hypothetical protein
LSAGGHAFRFNGVERHPSRAPNSPGRILLAAGSTTRLACAARPPSVHSGWCSAARRGFDCDDLGTFGPARVWPAHRKLDAVIAVLLFAVGAVLLAAGPVMVLRGRAGRGQIQHELAEQVIVFPQVDHLPVPLARFAGQ